jgi:hypothetical protein
MSADSPFGGLQGRPDAFSFLEDNPWATVALLVPAIRALYFDGQAPLGEAFVFQAGTAKERAWLIRDSL